MAQSTTVVIYNNICGREHKAAVTKTQIGFK